MLRDGEILKRDGLGRMLTTKERREAILAEFEQSGMSGTAFARLAGIKQSTFAWWVVQKRRGVGVAKGSKEGSGGAVQWVEAVVEKRAEVRASTTTKNGALWVEGPSGIRLELTEERHILWAAKLLRHLGETC